MPRWQGDELNSGWHSLDQRQYAWTCENVKFHNKILSTGEWLAQRNGYHIRKYIYRVKNTLFQDLCSVLISDVDILQEAVFSCEFFLRYNISFMFKASDNWNSVEKMQYRWSQDAKSRHRNQTKTGELIQLSTSLIFTHDSHAEH